MDGGPVLAVIVPTIGRPTLDRALASIGRDAAVVQVNDDPPHNDYGAWARNFGLRVLPPFATHVAYLDDDDEYLPGAVASFVAWATADPDALHIGRMLGDDGETVVSWRERRIAKGHVATPTMVAPADVAQRIEWQRVYDHDWRWARDVAAEVPRVVWHDEVVAVVRPQRSAR